MVIFIDLALCLYHGLGIYVERLGAIFAACTVSIAALFFLGKIFNGRSFKK